MQRYIHVVDPGLLDILRVQELENRLVLIEQPFQQDESFLRIENVPSPLNEKSVEGLR